MTDLKEHYTDERTGISYTLKGDYYYPDLTLPEQTHYEIGKYGRMHLAYIKQYSKARYNELLISGKLNEYLHGVDTGAKEYYERVLADIAKSEGINEELKARDQMKWVGLINNAANRADELTKNEYIFN